tara:strand:+ start:182 stop:1558 length:1377 start_codon:yes stop_codon:yes gene_type:complete
METEAIFENIADKIGEEISNAKSSIYIAVAWFTNKQLFNKLVERANNGCSVFLMVSNDVINDQSYIDYNKLNIKESKVYLVGDGDSDLMHHKFCVIDRQTSITGSYNWSYKAETNHENIIITSEDSSLANQFITEFSSIRRKYFPEDTKSDIDFPLDKILKRLEILKNFILLEDIEDIQSATKKLKQYEFHSDLNEILELLRKEEFSSAITKIQEFILKHNQLLIWIDPEIAALNLEIKNLENQLNAFDNEKVELKKLLSEFQHKHTNELGKIILEILKLRKLVFKDDAEKFEEAKQDEEEYQEHVDEEKEKVINEITREEKSELKKNYRKASMLCHSDKFVNQPLEIQKLAEEIFKDLNEANSQNDLKRVSEILGNLQNGILVRTKGVHIDDKKILKATIMQLKNKAKKLKGEILIIKESETYNTVMNIEDFDEYFSSLKEKLQAELLELKLKIDEV